MPLRRMLVSDMKTPPIQNLLNPLGITTYRKFAERIGIDPSYAWNIWHGKMPVTLGIARKIKAATGFTLDSILETNGEPKKTQRKKEN